MADSPTAPLSSRDYLESLRQRRLTGQMASGFSASQSQETTPVQSPPPLTNIPVQQPPLIEPHDPQIYQPAAPPTQPVPPVPPADPEATPLSNPTPTSDSPPPVTPAVPDGSGFQESTILPGQFKPMPEELIVEWRAPSRPFKHRKRQFFNTIFIIALLVSLILYFSGFVMPIAVVFAVTFLAYVLYSVPPEEITNKLTTYGIRTDEAIYYWEELGRFWFEDRLGWRTLNVETARFPGRITMLLGPMDELLLEALLSEALLKEKPAPTYMDKAAEWLTRKIPLDTL